MKYKVIIPEWNSGLNELLNSQAKIWDRRLQKYRVYNKEKSNNEKRIRECLRKQGLKDVVLKTPITLKYCIYAKDRKHDRMNLGSCLDKCFCDALQYPDMKILKADGWKEIVDIKFEYHIDPENPRAEIEITEVTSEKN